MELLKGQLVRLRAMEPSDAETMYRWENDTQLWTTSATTRPFSRAVLDDFVASASQDIFAARQLRLIVESLSDGRSVGCVDLFDFDPFHRRAGVGVLVYELVDRRCGYGAEALSLLCRYAFSYLRLEQLWADVALSNGASVGLFAGAGFEHSATRRRWALSAGGEWDDVMFFQKFSEI